MIDITPPIYLASKSPRRRELLEEAGIEVQVIAPEIDDAALPRFTATPEQWVIALAFLKARSARDCLCAQGNLMAGTILAADTVCVCGGEILGQPASRAEARWMLRRLRRGNHRTISGVCLLDVSSGERMLFCDGAVVRIGDVGDDQIESYLESERWRGKAGGYNLQERIDAGWPLECEGDPATVMGLPMRRLLPLLGV